MNEKQGKHGRTGRREGEIRARQVGVITDLPTTAPGLCDAPMRSSPHAALTSSSAMIDRTL